MKNKVFQRPKMWLPLYSFNIYNLQNPRIHAPQNGKKKSQIPVFQQWVNFQVGFRLKIADSEVLIN